MAHNINDLCRLCAKKDEFSKDLVDKTNEHVLKMIQELIHIPVLETENLPTKICLNCEDKVVSFQLFVLECLKVQETLRKMHLDTCENYPIKVEGDMIDFDVTTAAVKSEVKDEFIAEDIVSTIHNDESMSGFEAQLHDYDSDNKHDSDGDLSDVTLATLKETKSKRVKRRVLIEAEDDDFNNLIKKSNLNVKGFVKLQCDLCEETVRTWSGLRTHYAKVHKSKPMLKCMCGFVIRSKSVLYKHISEHRVESQKIKKTAESDSEKQEDEKYSNLNVTDFVNFTCTTCQKQCKSWYSLRAHCEEEHNIMPIVSCICGITLKSKSVLYKHVQDHKNPNVICCDKCPRITKTMAAMVKHKMRHVPKSERKFCCSSCDKVFNSKDTLKSHERSHIPIEQRKIYRCEICDLKFTTRSSASSHKRVVHDKIKSYVCDLCGYACGTNGELRQHRAIHSDDKPFVCRTCAKSFKTYSNLKTHMDTHEDTSYACYVCSRVLNSRRTLRKHLLVHEDKCRHVCSYCNKAFKRRQTLKVHMYTHTGDKPLSCKWCDERFSYASTLRSHRLRCHPDKMAAHYPAYTAHGTHGSHQNYMKNDTIPAKTDVEAI